MLEQVVCAAILLWSPCQTGWTNVGDAPAPREAFRADVDPAQLPKRPEQWTLDDAETRLLLPLISNDNFINRTQLFIDGWIAQSYNVNPYAPPEKTNGPVGYMDRANEYQLNELYLRAGRELDPTRDQFDFGAQVDFLYGWDAEYLQSRGLDRKIILDWRYMRMALPQAYASAFFPIGDGTTVQVGKFYAPFGLGTPTAVGGFFPTKSYARLYSEPFTLTGVSASQQFGEQLTLLGGVNYGWDTWSDSNGGVSGVAALTWRSCDHWTRFTLAGIGGRERDDPDPLYAGAVFPPGSSANRWLVTGTFERLLTTKWRYWAQGDWGRQEHGTPLGAADWYGVQQGVSYTINDCLTFGLRGEWFRDDDGVRVVNLRRSQPAPWIGTPADYFTVSFGAQFHVNMWITIRPELRYDWQRRDDPTAPAAFDAGRRSQQMLGVLDVVMRF